MLTTIPRQAPFDDERLDRWCAKSGSDADIGLFPHRVIYSGTQPLLRRPLRISRKRAGVLRCPWTLPANRHARSSRMQDSRNAIQRRCPPQASWK